MQLTGIHHLTAISAKPRENLAFYTGLLGMRLVKKTVNTSAPIICFTRMEKPIPAPISLSSIFRQPRSAAEVTAFRAPACASLARTASFTGAIA
jgi:catechol 2,3-dioxygenase-like lactoylglutathione lyase family enzyme